MFEHEEAYQINFFKDVTMKQDYPRLLGSSPVSENMKTISRGSIPLRRGAFTEKVICSNGYKAVHVV